MTRENEEHRGTKETRGTHSIWGTGDHPQTRRRTRGHRGAQRPLGVQRTQGTHQSTLGEYTQGAHGVSTPGVTTGNHQGNHRGITAGHRENHKPHRGTQGEPPGNHSERHMEAREATERAPVYTGNSGEQGQTTAKSHGTPGRAHEGSHKERNRPEAHPGGDPTEGHQRRGHGEHK